MSTSQTIVALATPSGRSGIGVIRLSGKDAAAYAGRLIGEEVPSFEPRHATLRTIVDLDTADAVDEAVLTFFKTPHSFTGEDVIEISCHGSPVLLRQVIDACLKLGARMAEPGEFTLRALANGRMDLSEAEAVRDLIDAQTSSAARQAVRQMRGEFSHRLQPIKDKLLDAIVILESALEFVEDDLPPAQTEQLAERLTEVANELGDLASTFKAGRLLREGLRVTLAGRPNVGKSSLFNALLGTDRAIVTEIAGTTRDQINESFVVNGIPVVLTDTAGLRKTEDTVESIGVERSQKAMADSDLVLVVVDASAEVTEEDIRILSSVRSIPHAIVLNKIDVLNELEAVSAADRLKRSIPASAEVVLASAKSGTGIDALKHSIAHPFIAHETTDRGFLVTDARHHDLLARAHEEVLSSITLLRQNTSEEITLIGLHNALRFLGQITGETTTEDMLTRIFATFCIGK